MNVHSKTEKEIFADMIVWYKFFLPQTFGSHVVYDRKKLNINTTYIKGPLKDLKTEWLFNPLKKKQTLINFKVDFGGSVKEIVILKFSSKKSGLMYSAEALTTGIRIPLSSRYEYDIPRTFSHSNLANSKYFK